MDPHEQFETFALKYFKPLIDRVGGTVELSDTSIRFVGRNATLELMGDRFFSDIFLFAWENKEPNKRKSMRALLVENGLMGQKLLNDSEVAAANKIKCEMERRIFQLSVVTLKYFPQFLK